MNSLKKETYSPEWETQMINERTEDAQYPQSSGKGDQNQTATPPHTHQGARDQTDTTTQVNLENVTLSGRIQVRNATHAVVLEAFLCLMELL